MKYVILLILLLVAPSFAATPSRWAAINGGGFYDRESLKSVNGPIMGNGKEVWIKKTQNSAPGYFIFSCSGRSYGSSEVLQYAIPPESFEERVFKALCK